MWIVSQSSAGHSGSSGRDRRGGACDREAHMWKDSQERVAQIAEEKSVPEGGSD